MPPRTPAAPIVRGSGVEFAPIASRGRGRLDCTFRLGAASRDSATQPRPGEALPLWRCRGGKEGLPAGWGRLWLLVPAGENANSRPFLPPCGCRLAHPSPHLPAAAAQDARKQCGDFAGDSFRFSGNSKESPATGAAPHGSRSRNPQRSGRGPGGTRLFRVPPAALRRFRRAKAASQQQKVQQTKRKQKSPTCRSAPCRLCGPARRLREFAPICEGSQESPAFSLSQPTSGCQHPPGGSF